MIKFRELLFLKNLKGVGKATIYKKYWDILINSKDFNDLVSKIEKDSKFAKEDIDKAIQNSSQLYDYVNNDKEIHVITVFDDNYPEKLGVMVNKRPLILYLKGNIGLLAEDNISVIGTRKPSLESKKFEKKLVKNIVKTDKIVVSGLALGCDKIAHQTTLDENKPTIAILPSGFNVISPASNKKLAQEILINGCLVSEYEPHAKAFKGTYVERDQLVAAFSDAIFVVECGIKSGTMHTVEAALKYEKKIFTYIPKNIKEGNFEGNVEILKNKNGIKVDSEDYNFQNIKNTSKQQTLI